MARSPVPTSAIATATTTLSSGATPTLNRVISPVRLEYRQQKTGGFVQAREVDYPTAQGSYVTRFAVNGDDYLQEGRVSAWRILVIENHQTIVAFRQSYLWR